MLFHFQFTMINSSMIDSFKLNVFHFQFTMSNSSMSNSFILNVVSLSVHNER